MKFFVDTADTAVISELAATGLLDGVTTNPSLIMKSGRDFKEVVAESWPNQTMLDSCVDCVDSWRHSSGHWQGVRSPHRAYAYDIRRGSNGIWYATGLFAD